MFRRALLLALVPALVFFAGCGDGDDPLSPIVPVTLVSNLSGAENSEIALDSGRVAAVGFTMPDSAAYNLSFARLKLRMDSGEGDSVTVRLFRNRLGGPDSLLVTFNSATLPITNGQPQTTLFTPKTGYVLAADSTYWLVVHNAGSGSVGWITGSPSLLPTGLATFAGAKVNVGIAPAPPTTTVNAIGQFSVHGTKR